MGVGLGIGIPAVAALFVGAFFLRRRKKRTMPGNGTDSHPSELGHVDYIAPETKYAYRVDSEAQG